MSVCVVLIQNYFKLIFQTFVSLFVLGFFYKVGNGEINGCGACKNILKSGGGGQKIFKHRVKGAVSEIVSLFLALMAPVILKKGSC